MDSSIEASSVSPEDSKEDMKEELRWPSPPEKKPVLQLPATPPRTEPASAPNTYFDALRGRGAPVDITKSPSDGTDVRWFYSKRGLTDDQSAALVPATEAALKGEWLRFGTRNSAALEAAYKQQEEKLLSCWWREFAEVSVGPQLRDRERIERGGGFSTQGSPQASPQKAHAKSAKASPAPSTRLKDDVSSASKGSPSKVRLVPSEQSAPQCGSQPGSDLEELPKQDKDEAEQSFLAKISWYLPSFKGSPHSPSKQQAEEKASESPAGLEPRPQAAVSQSGEETNASESPRGDGKGEEHSGEAFEDNAAEGLKEALRDDAVGKSSLAVPPSKDAAPLTDVTKAATVDPITKAQSESDSKTKEPVRSASNNESGEKEPVKSASDNEGGEKEPAKTATTSEADDSIEVGIQVKGGLYEGFLERRTLAPIFWKAAKRRILRGSWFAQPRKTRDWLPLREDIAEQLEIAYRGQVWRRRSFLPNGMYAHKVNLAGPSLGLYALFTGEDDTWEAWLGVDGSGVISRMFSSGHPTTRLRRGFRNEAPPQTQEEMRQRREEIEDDRKAQVPVKHLVFMVHGIGQRLERANIVDDAHKFQVVSDAMLEQFLSAHQRESQRVLFIPCQWRKILQLGGENIIDDITMEGIRGIRQIVNATVLDVLYYMSPVYCQDIINSVCRSLNRQYARFRRRNPAFDGQVHIFGHSLGSVLSYDILCHQPKPFLADLLARLQASAEQREDNLSGSSEAHSTAEATSEVAGSATRAEESSRKENKLGSIAEGSHGEESNEDEEKRRGDGASNEATSSGRVNETREGRESSGTGWRSDGLITSATELKGEKSVTKHGFCLEGESREKSDSCTPADGLEDGKKKEEAAMRSSAGMSRALSSHQAGALEAESISAEGPSPADVDSSHENMPQRSAAEEGSDATTGWRNSKESLSSAGASEKSGEESALRAEIARLRERLRRVETGDPERDTLATGAVMDGAEKESLSEATGQDGGSVNERDKGGEASDTEQSTETKVFAKDSGSGSSAEASSVNRLRLESSSQQAIELKSSEIHERKIESKVTEALQSLKLESSSRSKPVLVSTPSIDISIADLKGGTLNPEVLRNRGPHAFIHYPRLAFEVDTFFAVGSPLGMFLALRNIEFGSATRGENMDLKKLEESMPAARHMLNIFHPYDPVAYRIEPLVSKDFVSRRPVFIPYHRGGQRLHIGMAQFRDDLSARSKALQQDIMSSLSSMKTKITSTLTFRGAEQTEEEDSGEGGSSEVNDHTALVMERVTGRKHGRIDFMLQDATFEHPYISALSSHTAYWRDEDTALFVTRHLYRDVPEVAPGTSKEPGDVTEEAQKGEEQVKGTEDQALPISNNVGPRSRQSSTGSLKRSLSAGQLAKNEDPMARATFGNILWGEDREGALKPDAARTHFDSWIADDETGLFYMPGSTSP